MRAPEIVPVLSPGRHRSPRRGACLMELASFLAGEPWSDHPRGTHPLLAEVARGVNDLTGDEARQRLVVLAPDLACLYPHDRRVTALVARECALQALRVSRPHAAYAASVALLRTERALAELDRREPDALTPVGRRHLLRVDRSTRRRAEQFVATWWWQAGDFETECAPAIVRTCLSAIARSGIDDPDAALVALLERVVVLCREGADGTRRPEDEPASARMAACAPRSSSSPVRPVPARAGWRHGSDSPS